jgi:sugar-specific transcriptional regulator TrmB
MVIYGCLLAQASSIVFIDCDIMETGQILKDFGLTELEIKVYLALLRLGETTAPEIVKSIKSHDSNVYNTLGRLEGKGLASHVIKDGRAVYTPVDPKRILEIWESKKDSLTSILTMLQKSYTSKKSKPEVTVLIGIEGIKSVFDDISKTGKPAYSIGSLFQFGKIMKHRAPQIFKKVQQSGVVGKLAVTDNPKTRAAVKEHLKEFSFAEIKFYPEQFKSPISFTQYDDKVALLIWGDEIFAIIIKDKCAAKGFKSYFDMIWMISKK